MLSLVVAYESYLMRLGDAYCAADGVSSTILVVIVVYTLMFRESVALPLIAKVNFSLKMAL